jgi:2-haloacid dehalogenase
VAGTPNFAGVKALTFDVFGTCVDWRGSIIREGDEWGRTRGIQVDWAAFADQWRAAYRPSMDKVRRGELPWTTFDGLHRRMLNDLLVDFNITALTEEEKDHWNRVWHRLHPWPDSVRGLARLKQEFMIATLSNGNVSMLINLSRFAGLAWDTVLSAELFRHYKPDREVYLGAAELLGCRPAEVMMVAAHDYDLRAARSFGLKTAFVSRPLEFGPNQPPPSAEAENFDICAKDFLDLAGRLSA